jgi:hypothetical protein
VITLESLIGKEIVAFVPVFHQTKWQQLKLVNVEAAGLWVESKTVQEWAIEGTSRTATPKTAVFFLPFSQIVFVLESLDVPWLSERLLR